MKHLNNEAFEKAFSPSYVQPSTQLSVIPHLHINSLVQTQANEIQWLLNRVRGLLLKQKVRHEITSQ